MCSARASEERKRRLLAVFDNTRLYYKQLGLKWFKIVKVGGIGDGGMHVFAYGAAITDLCHKKRMFHLKRKNVKMSL